MQTLLDRLPVIVGAGEITQRTKDPAVALEPLRLMEQALRAADQDAGGGLLSRLDSLDVVAEYSWPYDDAPGRLAALLPVQPARRTYGEVGGESPVRFLHDAALRIWRGESAVAAVVGAESNYAVEAARKQGATLPWTPRDTQARLVRGADYLHPLSVRLGVASPATVYPFYENAAQAAWGQTPAQALAESGQLWARCSEVAAANPHAWKRQAYEASQITMPSPDNRLVAWPYTVRMVANPMVNQGAALVLTSQGLARQLGIPQERLVHVWCGAAAAEPADYLERDQFVRSHAQDAVLERILQQVGGVGSFSHVELYSCFPVVPKMARRTLALPADATVTCAGGLSFFGAPLNNYMSHAAAAMVRGLRGRPDSVALLYGQGGYVTKHHAIVLASYAAGAEGLVDDYDVQSTADARRAVVPPLDLDHAGAAVLETHTVLFGRDGQPQHGVVLGRTAGGARIVARVDGTDAAGLAVLTGLDRTAVGRRGEVRPGAEGVPTWRFLQ